MSETEAETRTEGGVPYHDAPVGQAQNALVAPAGGLPAWAAAKMAKAPAYEDNLTQRDMLLPWLVRVGGSSNFVKKNKPQYIEGASIGDITDTLTLTLRRTQPVLLVKYEVHYTTFKGLKVVNQWYTDRSAYDAANFPPGKNYGKKIDADGNEVQEIPMYYILMLDMRTGASRPACMAWGSTQAKKVRRVNALAKEDIFVPTKMPDGRVVTMPQVPPLYARVFDIGTVEEANDENSWVGWTASVGDLVWMNADFGEAWFAKAEAFRDQIERGNVRPMPVENEDAETERADVETYRGGVRQEPPSQRKLDDDIPF